MRTVEFLKTLIVLLVLLSGAAPIALGQARPGAPGYDAYQAGDYAAALKSWLPEAEAGDADIQSRVGLMYMLAEGTERDIEQAARWFARSAKQNFGAAQYHLGKLYDSGAGVGKDDIMAYVMLRAAVENGFSRAAVDLKTLVAELTPAQIGLGDMRLAEWWQVHPKKKQVEEVAGEDTRTLIQKFNDWLVDLMS